MVEILSLHPPPLLYVLVMDDPGCSDVFTPTDRCKQSGWGEVSDCKWVSYWRWEPFVRVCLFVSTSHLVAAAQSPPPGCTPAQPQGNAALLVKCINLRNKVHSLSLTFSPSSMSYSSSLCLASQFFWIRQTTHGILCISSFWQALKALTNDSLIQRKTEGGEGEADKNNGLPQLWGAC